jgi:hypothetical protein
MGSVALVLMVNARRSAEDAPRRRLTSHSEVFGPEVRFWSTGRRLLPPPKAARWGAPDPGREGLRDWGYGNVILLGVAAQR